MRTLLLGLILSTLTGCLRLPPPPTGCLSDAIATLAQATQVYEACAANKDAICYADALQLLIEARQVYEACAVSMKTGAH